MKETKQATKVSVSISERIAVLVIILAAVAFGGTLLALLLFTSLEPRSVEPAEEVVKNYGMADPSAVYCKMLGYAFEIEDTELGQRGICVLPGEKCDAWAFLSGTCGQEYSYCVKNGYEIETRSDGQDPFSKDYAVCVSSSKNVIGSITKLTDLSEKSQSSYGSNSSVLPEYNNEEGINLNVNLEDVPISLPDDQLDSKSLPSSFDWRDHNGYNWMTKVKQQDCGDCWAHSIIGTTEAAFNIAMGNEGIPPNYSLDLSEQQLVSDCFDCDVYSNCQGATPSCRGIAINGIRDYGIVSEDCFPYLGINFACSWCQSPLLLKTNLAGRITDIKNYIVNYGPVSTNLQLCGNFDDDDLYSCSYSDDDTWHGVVITGYDDVGGYWIVKNSYGDSWGPNYDGYFKVKYGNCGIGGYHTYSLSGITNPYTCDSGNMNFRRGALWDGSVGGDPYDVACCDNATDHCVFNGECYYGGVPDEDGWTSQAHDVEYGTNKFLVCSTQGLEEPSAWANPDYSKWWCDDPENGLAWHVDTGDANIESEYHPYGGETVNADYCAYNWVNDGDNTKTRSTECCCGDDAGEYYSVSPKDGTAACCNTYNECVIGGVCQNHMTMDELCYDGVDNDCDGLIDCDDPDCTDPDTTEICWTPGDDNCDGLIDCDDPDCQGWPAAYQYKLVYNNPSYVQCDSEVDNINITEYNRENLGDSCTEGFNIIPDDLFYYKLGSLVAPDFPIQFETNWDGDDMDIRVEGQVLYYENNEAHYRWEEIQTISWNDGIKTPDNWYIHKVKGPEDDNVVGIRILARGNDPECGTAQIRNFGRFILRSQNCGECGDDHCEGITLCKATGGAYCSSKGMSCPLDVCDVFGVCIEGCQDATPYGECNSDNEYCDNGTLRSGCAYCGASCPAGYDCYDNKCCKKVDGSLECLGGPID